jgi:anti-sigma regulatory factor (Ser/Thr protein kinase)
MSEGEADIASFEVTVAADAGLVATVRRFVGELCGRLVGDRDVVSRVVVATHELFENAARHASREVCRLRVEVRRMGEDVVVRIVTQNRVTDERRDVLASVMGQMSAGGDPVELYRGLLDRVAGGVDAGLGLGRVHGELDFRLSSRFEDDDVVIQAEGRFPLNAR